MTKKHFIALADAMRGSRPTTEDLSSPFAAGVKLRQWSRDLDAICRFYRSQNKAFNEDRFRAYINGECGPDGGKR